MGQWRRPERGIYAASTPVLPESSDRFDAQETSNGEAA